MRPKFLSLLACGLALVLCPVQHVHAQTQERIGKTWKGPSASLIKSILKNTGDQKPATRSTGPRAGVLKFTPAGDSGVSRSLAEAFGSSAEQRAALVEAFEQIKQGYEAEVAKEGKSNDLAAAMTFFIGVNVTAFHRTEMPSDDVSETLYQSLRETMAATPAFAELSNAEKQQMHDWLVCMAGLVLTSYADAKQKGDAGGVNEAAELADYSMRLVLGVDIGKMSFKGDKLSVEGGVEASPTASSTDNRIVGVWSLSASSPANSNLVTNAGYYKGQYQFKPDGTYSFKSERWYGYMRSKEFYTTEESGTYSVNGDSLTVSPRTSKTILRNPEGIVQKTQNNPLEKVIYRWQLHHFEGINETQLILQPPRETTRDGGFSQSSVFPNSYLYSPGGNLEWRF